MSSQSQSIVSSRSECWDLNMQRKGSIFGDDEERQPAEPPDVAGDISQATKVLTYFVIHADTTTP
jgi:hypothetical protein